MGRKAEMCSENTDGAVMEGRSSGGAVTYLARSRRCVLYTVQCTDRE